MRNATFWVVLAAAGAAFGIGYFVGTSSAPPAPISDDDVPEVDAAVRTAPRELLSGTEGPQLEGGPTDKPGIRRLLASYPLPERQTGSGTITGTVRTADGEPLEGVQIVAVPRREDDGARSFDPDMTREERAVQMIDLQLERLRWEQANEITATTDAEGAFTLSGVHDAKHGIRAELSGWRIHGRNAYNAEPGGDVGFTASRVTGLHLDIFAPDGSEPERASLSFRSGTSGRSHGWTPKRKRVEVQAGLYDLHVTAGKHEELRAGPIEVEVGTDGTLRVDLELRPVLRVELAFPEGEMTGGHLYTLPVSTTDPPSGAVLRARGKSEWLHHQPGRAGGPLIQTLKELRVGQVAVGYSRGQAGPFDVIEVVEVRAGLHEYTLEVPKLDPKRYVAVRVTDPSGKPITNARFSTGYRGETFSSSGGSTFVHRGDGEYYVLHNEHGADHKGGTYWVEVQAGKLGSKRVEYGKGASASTFDVRFEEPASADVTVQNLTTLGEGQTVKVFLQPVRDEKQPRHHRYGSGESCNEKGLAQFKSLQPGRYQVSISVGTGHWPAHVHSEEVTITTGKNAFTIALPALYTVTIRNAGKHVWVQRLNEKGKPDHGTHRNANVADGEAVVDALTAGRYRAQSNRRQADFEVPGTTLVTLEDPKK